MSVLARLVLAHPRWLLLAWLVLAVAGGLAAPRATSALSYDFGLPGQRGFQTNQQIVRTFGSGGDNAPILLVNTSATGRVAAAGAAPIPSWRAW